MKRTLRSLLIGSSILAAPQIASASMILAGWHDFTSDAVSQTPDDYADGFDTSSVNKNAVNSFNSSGSSDGAYGGKDPGLDKPGAVAPVSYTHLTLPTN